MLKDKHAVDVLFGVNGMVHAAGGRSAAGAQQKTSEQDKSKNGSIF